MVIAHAQGNNVNWRPEYVNSTRGDQLKADMMHEALHIMGMSDNDLGSRLFGSDWAAERAQRGTVGITTKIKDNCFKNGGP